MNTNLQEFNASKFVLFSSLLLFSVLYTLKLDGVIHWTWWTIFLPLWIWKGIAISGACVGSYVWWRRPQSRLNNEEYLQYKAMLISLAVHLLLLMFELLAADNLDTRRHKVGGILVETDITRFISVDPGIHPPGGGQHHQHCHLCVECQTRQVSPSYRSHQFYVLPSDRSSWSSSVQSIFFSSSFWLSN